MTTPEVGADFRRRHQLPPRDMHADRSCTARTVPLHESVGGRAVGDGPDGATDGRLDPLPLDGFASACPLVTATTPPGRGGGGVVRLAAGLALGEVGDG